MLLTALLYWYAGHLNFYNLVQQTKFELGFSLGLNYDDETSGGCYDVALVSYLKKKNSDPLNQINLRLRHLFGK